MCMHTLLRMWLVVGDCVRADLSWLSLERFSRYTSRSGTPLLRQLLMGEGKSAVIAPLLSLLLAQDERWTFQKVANLFLLFFPKALRRVLPENPLNTDTSTLTLTH